MHKVEELVINTSPLLALIAAWDDLSVLQMYSHVWVPFEVCQEILAGGSTGFGVAEFQAAHGLKKQTTPLEIVPFLRNSLDRGEASVIQLALNKGIQTVCIDEPAGRRVARLNGLSVTGSVGVLLRAWREGHRFSMQEAIQKMRRKGIWLSDRVVTFALTQTGEKSG